MGHAVKALFQPLYAAFLSVFPDRAAVTLDYWLRFGRHPNLDHPRSFSEKIAWRKLYQKDPRFTLCSDKVAVKEWVAARVGAEYVIPSLWVGERAEDIDFGRLTTPCIVKVNHDSGGHIFVPDPSRADRAAIVRKVQRKLQASHAALYREWGYRNIPPRVLVEPLLVEPGQSNLTDYMFFVFAGKVHYIEVCQGSFAEFGSCFFDRAWNKMPFRFGGVPDLPGADRPENLERMVEIAERLGQGFDFVRVDLYNIDGQIFFGECTFYPHGGTKRVEPSDWDEKMGGLWPGCFVRRPESAVCLEGGEAL